MESIPQAPEQYPISDDVLYRLGIKKTPEQLAALKRQLRQESYEKRLKAGVHETRKNKCWEWYGGRNPAGYGIIAGPDGKRKFAHRAYYEKYHGPIPERKYVCHRCDNPPCCNPDHLFLGSPADNMQDMSRKKRSRKSARDRRSERDRMIQREAWILLKGGIRMERICKIYRLTMTQLERVMGPDDPDRLAP